MALGAQLGEVVDAFSELVAQHVRLAKLELAADARFVGVRVGLLAALAPLLLVGWGFLCVALALLLGRWMAPELGFVIVGVLNLAVAGGGMALIGRQLGAHKPMTGTAAELDNSKALLLPTKQERSP